MREERIRLLRECVYTLDRLFNQEEENRNDFTSCVGGDIRTSYEKGVNMELEKLRMIRSNLLRLLAAEERKQQSDL